MKNRRMIVIFSLGAGRWDGWILGSPDLLQQKEIKFRFPDFWRYLRIFESRNSLPPHHNKHEHLQICRSGEWILCRNRVLLFGIALCLAHFKLFNQYQNRCSGKCRDKLFYKVDCCVATSAAGKTSGGISPNPKTLIHTLIVTISNLLFLATGLGRSGWF